MKKKKTGLIAIIIIVSAIILGLCFLRFWGQDKQNKRDEIQNVTSAEATAEPTTEQTMEPDGEDQEAVATQEQQTGKEQQEKEAVWIVEEEGVRNNPIFAAFIDKEITAYDREEEKSLYIYEYFADYGRIDYVHFMAEDLNQDTRNELLVYVERAFGDLLVFEETESGELIAWEIWDYVTNDRQSDIYYCGNGTFMMYGGRGISVGHYAQEGTPEPQMDYFHTIKESNDTYYMVHIWLRLYENGKVVKEMEYECYYDTETDEAITELQSEEAREGEKLIDEMLAVLIEEKEISIGGAEYRDEYKDRVKSVFLDELQSPSEVEIAALGMREDMLAYWMVLNSKKPFVSTDKGGQKFYWNEWFWYFGDVDTRYHAEGFMIVDMDGDGSEEVVLDCSPEATQVLHYEEGEVYSYQFVFRGMSRIHNNGIYEGSAGASSTFYYRLTELNKDGYKEETIAVMDGDYYEVEGNEAAYEEFCDYVDPIESVELADRMEFTESMLDWQLLGSLSEQELALVKRIPAENMPEKEPYYQEHKQALQLYAAVLSGEEEEIYVTVDACPWIDEPVRVYFSLVDMDRDGVYELVFTCEDHIIQILHYEEGKAYCYQLRTYIYRMYRTAEITTDGVFRRDSSPIEYARIASFETDGCQVEPVEDYDISSHDWIRYYFYSDETIAQWLK